MISLDFFTKKFSNFEQILERNLSNYLEMLTDSEKETVEKSYQSLLEKYGENEDPWGLNIPKAQKKYRNSLCYLSTLF